MRKQAKWLATALFLLLASSAWASPPRVERSRSEASLSPLRVTLMTATKMDVGSNAGQASIRPSVGGGVSYALTERWGLRASFDIGARYGDAPSGTAFDVLVGVQHLTRINWLVLGVALDVGGGYGHFYHEGGFSSAHLVLEPKLVLGVAFGASHRWAVEGSLGPRFTAEFSGDGGRTTAGMVSALGISFRF